MLARSSGNLLRFKGLNVHLNKGDERTTEIRQGATATINDRTCRRHDPSMVLHDLNGLQQASSSSNDIFCDQKCFPWRDRKSTSEDQAARAVLFGEDMSLAKMSCDFLSDDNSSDRRRNHRCCLERPQLLGEQAAYVRSGGGIL